MSPVILLGNLTDYIGKGQNNCQWQTESLHRIPKINKNMNEHNEINHAKAAVNLGITYLNNAYIPVFPCHRSKFTLPSLTVAHSIIDLGNFARPWWLFAVEAG